MNFICIFVKLFFSSFFFKQGPRQTESYQRGGSDSGTVFDLLVRWCHTVVLIWWPDPNSPTVEGLDHHATVSDTKAWRYSSTLLSSYYYALLPTTMILFLKCEIINDFSSARATLKLITWKRLTFWRTSFVTFWKNSRPKKWRKPGYVSPCPFYREITLKKCF